MEPLANKTMTQSPTPKTPSVDPHKDAETVSRQDATTPRFLVLALILAISAALRETPSAASRELDLAPSRANPFA